MMKKPIIMTAAIGARENQEIMNGLTVLVNSAAQYAPEAELVVITDKRLSLPENVRQLPVSGVGGDVHPVCSRWYFMKQYLSFMPDDVPMFIMDARDCIINDRINWEQFNDRMIHIYAEDARYKLYEEQSNASWLHAWFGFPVKFGKEIFCAGVIGGLSGCLLQHVSAMWDAMAVRKWFGFGADQVAHNLVCYAHKNQEYLCHANGSQVLHCILAPIADWELNGNCQIIPRPYSPNQVPKIVHQYDRWNNFHRSILARYEK